jgi:hypothetical protein
VDIEQTGTVVTVLARWWRAGREVNPASGSEATSFPFEAGETGRK